MSGEYGGEDTRRFDIDDFVSKDEREHMLFELHRYFAWVGEPIPDKITINEHTVRLHDLIWKLIHLETLNEGERKWIKKLIHDLEEKEEFDEGCLRKAKLTREQARHFHDEAAGLLRAIMDLKDVEEGRIERADFDELAARDKVEDARRWVKYVKGMRE